MNRLVGLLVICFAFACSSSTAPVSLTPCTSAIDSALILNGTPIHADTVTADSILELQNVRSSVAAFEWVKVKHERHGDTDKTTTDSKFSWKSNINFCSISTVITKDE